MTCVLVIEIHGLARLADNAGGRVGGAILATAASTTTTTAARTHFVARGFVFWPAFGIQAGRGYGGNLLFVQRGWCTPCGRGRRSFDRRTWRGRARPLFGVQVLLGNGCVFATVARATSVATIAAPLLFLALSTAWFTALAAIASTVALALR